MTPNERDTKLIQYLNEAYGKERQLETALQAHIAMTTRKSYRRRLEQHLSETKRHAREVERRVKQLGGQAETTSLPGPAAATDAAQALQSAAHKAAAIATGPIHALRGTGESEKLLKNAKTEYADEAQEIATYTAIEALADSVGDRETVKLARAIRREEERMASFLEKLIPSLTRAVAHDEIPAGQRNGGRSGRSGSSRAKTARARAGTRSRGTSRSRATKTPASGPARRSNRGKRTGGRRRSTARGRS